MIKKKHKKTKRQLDIKGKTIEYTLYKNSLSKSIKLSVRPDGSVLLSTPRLVSTKKAEAFAREKSSWVLDKIKYFESKRGKEIFRKSRKDYLKDKEKARRLVAIKVREFNDYYNFSIARIFIRDQKTRWGSCSARGNLNFNYRLLYLPEALLDYVIVHEICHLKEMNHSPRFWQLVAKTIPNYKERRRKLRKRGLELF